MIVSINQYKGINMRNVANYIKNKAGFLLAVAFAATIGGISTGAVMAAIPSGDAQITGCYRNTAGDFDPAGSVRVIDAEDSETCTVDETALNWDQPGWKGYGYIQQDGTLDTARSRNITSVTPYITEQGQTGFCVFADIEPDFISLTSSINVSVVNQADVRGAEVDSTLDELCGSSVDAVIATPTITGGIYFYLR